MKCEECDTEMKTTTYPNDEEFHRCGNCGRSSYTNPVITRTPKEAPEQNDLPEGFIISKENFNRLFLDRLAHCKDLVLQKEAEYSKGKVDRMIQFVEDARMNDITVAQSCWNSFSKHVTSLRLAIKNEEKVTEKWIDDRITDMMIYPTLLEAILRRTQLEDS